MQTPPPQTDRTEPTDADIEAFQQQLGRPPRGLRAIAHRCPCGQPDVVETAPRLPDGTPFPTLYYLTCPRAASAIGTLEANGVMKEMQAGSPRTPSSPPPTRPRTRTTSAAATPSRCSRASRAPAGCRTG